MYILLKNIISEKNTEKFINIYKDKNDVGVINKKVFEFRTNWNKIVDNDIKGFLHENIIPHASQTWRFNTFNFTNIKIREYPTGSFYEPHVDFHNPLPSKIYLSFSIILNDAFEGGELKIGNNIFNVRKGDGILFQATDLHEVLPITKGFRMALIGHFIADKV